MLNSSYMIFIVIAFFHIHTVIASNEHWSVGQPVGTSSGIIGGHAASNRDQVSEYLGIPYAQSPTNTLRFAAPLKYSDSGFFDATYFGLACPQVIQPPLNTSFPGEAPNTEQIFDSSRVSAEEIGEDCLNLNVWTKPQTGESGKAVFVFIHGGAFENGASRFPIYNGQYIADEEDVVVVTVNYRLNVFGFPGIPSVPEIAQNAGLLDQRMAIEWIRDNIEAFGGDPARIVIAGQSAGATSVDYYTYAWTDDPIVAGFIAESGTANRLELPELGATGVAPNAIEAWYNLSSTLGCGGSNVSFDSTISCVRKQDFTDVLRAIPPRAGSLSGGGTFYPTIDNRTVFANYTTLGTQGKFIKKPYLIGSNNNEGAYWQALQHAQDIYLPQALWNIFNAGFTCQGLYASTWRARQQSLLWRYRYFGDFETLRLFNGSGAYHAEELAVYFGTSEDLTGEAPTPGLVAFGDYMRKAFMNFAKDPTNGLTNMQWPTFSPRTKSLIRLAYPGAAAASPTNPDDYDYICYMFSNITEQLFDNQTLNARCKDEATETNPWGALICAINARPEIKQLLLNSTAVPSSSGSTSPHASSNAAASTTVAQAGTSAFFVLFIVLLGVFTTSIAFQLD